MLKGEKRHFRELAEYVKKEFDTRFPGTWHVIVGKYFSNNLIFLWKTSFIYIFFLIQWF